MRKQKQLMALSLALVFSGCATLGGSFKPFGACTTSALEKTGHDLVGDLVLVFATQAYEAEVAKLATEFGVAEVKCAVDLLIDQFSHRKSLTPAGSATLANARAWRAKNQ